MGGANRGNRPGFVLPLLCNILLIAVFSHSCKADEDSSGCRHIGHTSGVYIQCKNITDFSSVTEAITYQNEFVIRFMIQDSPQFLLTREGFDNIGIKNLRDLHLQRNGITFFDPEPLQGFSHLIVLSLKDNNMTALNADAFSGLGSVTILRLNENQISDINPTAFQSLPNLTYLDLSGNRLKSIPANIFQGLNELKSLDLSENLITSIEKGQLNGLNKLIHLTLKGNQIETIDSTAFQTLTSLATLDLPSNKLVNFDSRSFENNPIVILDISFNPLENLVNFPLNISTLQYLSLSDCGIQTIPVNYFKNLPNLVILDFTGNKVSKIDVNAFAHLTEIRHLSFDKNNLVSIGVKSYQQLKSILNKTPTTIAHGSGLYRRGIDLEWSGDGMDKEWRVHNPTLYLRHNPWDCNTDDMVELRKWFREQKSRWFFLIFKCGAAFEAANVDRNWLEYFYLEY